MQISISFQVHIFWEDHKILQNLHQSFVLRTASQIIGGVSQNFVGFSEYMTFNKEGLNATKGSNKGS